jgi:hypothetical protein
MPASSPRGARRSSWQMTFIRALSYLGRAGCQPPNPRAFAQSVLDFLQSLPWREPYIVVRQARWTCCAMIDTHQVPEHRSKANPQMYAGYGFATRLGMMIANLLPGFAVGPRAGVMYPEGHQCSER